MHLLAAQSGILQQEGEAIDLDQAPGEIIFVSAADSELCALAAAASRAGETGLRLVNFLQLSHNMSVDLWLQKTASGAKLIVVRLLGGTSYWQYGVDELARLADSGNLRLVFLPGDATVDPQLLDLSNIEKSHWQALHGLFVAGGPENMDLALAAFKSLAASGSPGEVSARPFARFGAFWPGKGMVDPEQLERLHGKIAGPGKGVGRDGGHNVPLLFYRAALEGAGTATVQCLIEELSGNGMRPVPLVISSLKEGACIRFVRRVFEHFPPSVIFNMTGFALGLDGMEPGRNPFADISAPVIQLVQNGRSREAWQDDIQGLGAKDLAMQVVLPELDGRIGALIVGHKQPSLWNEDTQCFLNSYAPDHEGICRAVELAGNWTRLQDTPRKGRRIAMVLANYPIRDGRIANGVGYDAPASSLEILRALKKAGYAIGNLPQTSNELIGLLQSGPTNANPSRGEGGAVLDLETYGRLFEKLPEKIRRETGQRWGKPENDPFCRPDGFHLPVIFFGNVAVLLQPSRGYDLDEEASYHDPDLVPPHAYLAVYLWTRHVFGAHALVHNGKHGNLEWLPGKAVALDLADHPAALWAGLPHFYPFIVNDPGEGTQAKRRTGAVIIDHLVPPLTRAETYGPLKDLESLLDEYYAASGMDRRRLEGLKRRILDFTRDTALDRDIDLPDDEDQALGEIDNFLCELKEAQIRDGLHVFGISPEGEQQRDLLVALSRIPRGTEQKDASLIRAIADDLRLGFDPLDARLADRWNGPRPALLHDVCKDHWRNVGDTLERLELLAAQFVQGRKLPPDFMATAAVLDHVNSFIRPRLAACGPAEINALIDGLDGKFIAPGPSGAPSRGRLDVLPTGRNFYSLDNRALPTPTAWELGYKSAENLALLHFQQNGTHLRSLALGVWGTANMRTGGDDIAQALAFIGARPRWDPGSLRVSGFEIIPLAKLGRPRIDVVLRISGFFRDAFPQLVTLFDQAIRAVGALDEPEDQNPIAAAMRRETLELMERGNSELDAALGAGHRIFGSRPGSYGAGLQGLMDNSTWDDKSDLAGAFLEWGQYAYGLNARGLPEHERFAARLGGIDAVVHNQDNREHDLLDSDDYYQFEGGLFVTAQSLSGRKPAAYHNDHSRPQRPLARTLEMEISRVMRSRVLNPRWIGGVMNHGYKGAFEIIATVDYMFAFAATTGAVKTHHFDLAFEAFVLDEEVRDFIRNNNSHGHDELLMKFNEAVERGLWTPKSNSAYAVLNGEE